MAKIITTRRRRSSAAKVAKKARRAARRVVVKTKKIYRSAKGVNVSKKDIIVYVAAGGAGAIGASFVLTKLPIANEYAKNAAVAAVGGFLAYKGMKKRNLAIASAGFGMSAVAAANVIKKVLPAGTMAAPYVSVPQLAAPIPRRPVAAPYVTATKKVNIDEYV